MKHIGHFRAIGPAFAGAFMLMAPGLAGAAEQPLTTTMSCATVQNAVKNRGAIVLWTGPHLYDRYVDNGGFCPLTMRPEAAWIPTRDNPQCFVGYTCEQAGVRRRR